MKRACLFILMIFPGTCLLAQQRQEAEKLVIAGITLHDKGDYEGAIAAYDNALKLDSNSFFALAEKAYSIFMLGRYDEAIETCKATIRKHPNSDKLGGVYVTYGNALDALKRPEDAVRIYEEGISHFGDFHLLFFNKAITLSSMNRYDEAIPAFQKSVTLEPKHASSHNAIARILLMQKNTVPSLLAFCRFLMLEPKGERAKENLEYVKKIMKGNTEKHGNKNVRITIDPAILADTTKEGKPKENSFSTASLILSMASALNYDNNNKTEVALFSSKFETLCVSLQETRKSNHGFYWDYYVPYFIEIKDKGYIETIARIVYASSDDAEVNAWINDYIGQVKSFYNWSDTFIWHGSY